MSTLLGDAKIRIRPDLTGFESEAQRSIGGSFKKIAAVAGAALATVGAAAFAKSTLEIGRTYEGQLNTLRAVSQATATQMSAVSKTAKELGSDLTLPATSAADAAAVMTELAKASFTVEEAQTAAKGSLQLAAAAQIDAAKAANIQAAALQAYSLEADQAGRVSDVLANAANASSAEITDVSDALSQASAVAAASRISIEDTAAAIGILANNGIRGSDAGTLLKSALLALQSPSGPAQKAMESLSLSAYDASGNFVGLSSIFGQLAEAQKRMTPEAYAMATSTLFGSDAARLAGIAGKEGSEGFDAMAAAMSRSGAAADVAAAKAQGVGGAIEAFKSQVETFQIDLFERGAPNIEKLVRYAAENFPKVGDALIDGVENAIEWLGNLKDEGVETFDAVRDYLEPVTSEVDDFRRAMTAANGPGEILFDLLRSGGGILVDLFQAASPVVGVVGDLLGLFNDLPGPVQAAVLALVALKVATGTDLLGRLAGRNGLTGAVGQAGSSLVGFAQTARVNARLAGDEIGAVGRAAGGLSAAFQTHMPRTTAAVQNSMAGISSSFTQARLAHREMVTQLNGAGSLSKGVGDIAGFSAAAKTAATQGVGALRTAAGGLASYLGGPWGLALIAGTLLIGGITAEMQKSEQQANEWATALQSGGAAAAQALRDAEAERKRYGDGDGWFDNLNYSLDKWAGFTPDLEKATKAANDHWKSLDPIPQAQSKVAEWTNTLSHRIDTLGTSHEDTRTAQERLAYWTNILGERQSALDNQTQSATEAIAEQAQVALAATNADVAYSMAQTSLARSMEDYRTQIADATLSELDKTAATDQMAQSAISAANAAAAQASAQAEAAGATDKQAYADKALLASLQETAKQLGDATPQAIRDLIASLNASGVAAELTDQMMADLGLTVINLPSEHGIVIDAPTQEQKDRLLDLGVVVRTLPNGQIMVSADTNPAEEEIRAFLQTYRTEVIKLRSQMSDLDGPGVSGNGRMGNLWSGGYTGDGGKFEPKAVVHGGEYVFTKEETARAGVANLAAYARSLRGYYNGGLVDINRHISATGGLDAGDIVTPVHVETGDLKPTFDTLLGRLKAAADNSAGSGSLGGAWGSLWQVVKAAIPQARMNSTFRAGDPGYHGKGKAIDFGFGSGPGGAGSAGLAAIARFLYKGYGRNLAELIYTGIGDNTPDVKNGRDHVYNAATRAGHQNHVHAAVYDTGGVLEPGMTLVDNRSRKVEGVLNNEQLGWLQSAATGRATPLIGGDLVLQVDPTASIHDQMETAMHELRRIKRGGGVR